MIEYITAYTANDPLAVWILPGTAWCSLHFFNAHVLDALLNMLTVDPVPVSQQVTWGGLPGKRLDDLLCGPLCSGMLGNVAMHDAPTLVSQHNKHEEDPEAGSWHGEKVTGYDVRDMVGQKGLP